MSPPNGDVPVDVPSGPWLLVAGMHRSGTSAVSGALGGLGFQTPSPDDRMDWPESNPEHWESLSLTLHDDLALSLLGGSWDAPPDLPDGWEPGVELVDAPDPRPLVAAAFPEPGALVWKDPRLSLLFPYWRPILPDPLAVVVVWRSPMAVADSLHRRDGMDLLHGVALWERYNRSALATFAGVDTYIASYEGLLADPPAFVESITGWLGSLDRFDDLAGRWDLDAAVASLSGSMDHHGELDDGVLLDEQRQLVALLTASEGGHRSLRIEHLGAESPWTTSLIRGRREFRSRELDAERTAHGYRVAEVQAMADFWERTANEMTASTSWRVTRPLRSAVARVQRPTPSSGRLGDSPGNDIARDPSH
ncbi:MAG TPA: hypothetical protein VF320_04885 [Acidimicrobiales bacterium]